METLAQPEGLEAIEGKSRRWTDEEILLLIALSQSDILAGIDYWRLIAPRGWQGIIRPVRVPSVPTDAPPVWFSVPDQRYGIGSRGVVPKNAIRGAVRIAASNAGARLANLSRALQAGSIDLPTWQQTMAVEIKQASVAFSAVGAGGPEGLTARHYADLSGRLKFQYERLERYAKQIELEEPTITVESLTERPPKYMLNARTAVDESERISHEEENYIQELNVLGPAEHCRTTKKTTRPDCPSITDKGWQPIGTGVQIGSRICLWNCLCSWAFRKKPDSDSIRRN